MSGGWTMPCLTVRQPTGWLLQERLQGFINKSFRPPLRLLKMGQVFALHVAGAGTDTSRTQFIDEILEVRGYPQRVPNQLPLGVVLGVFRFQGATEGFENDPFRDNQQYAWIVKPVYQLSKPMSARGETGLWYLPADLYRHLLTSVSNTVRSEINAAAMSRRAPAPRPNAVRRQS